MQELAELEENTSAGLSDTSKSKSGFLASLRKRKIKIWDAIAADNYADVTQWVDDGGDPNKHWRKSKHSLLHEAASSGSLCMCQLLVGLDAIVDWRDKDGQTPADLAAQKGFSEVASWLRSCSTAVNGESHSKKGSTLKNKKVWKAAERGNAKFLSEWIGKGGDINSVRPQTGTTMLHEAASRGNLPLVQMLCGMGGRMLIKDGAGRRAHELARASGFDDVYTWMRRRLKAIKAEENQDSDTEGDAEVSSAYQSGDLRESLSKSIDSPRWSESENAVMQEYAIKMQQSRNWVDRFDAWEVERRIQETARENLKTSKTFGSLKDA